jgi:hypothetical protein
MDIKTQQQKGTFRICKEITIDYSGFISNLLSDGLHYFSGYGFEFEVSESLYAETKSKMPNGVSFEDICTQIVMDGGEITFIDVEGDGEYTRSFTLDAVEKALWKFLDERPSDAFILAFERLTDEDYDADDCDVLLQHILFGEYMFS